MPRPQVTPRAAAAGGEAADPDRAVIAFGQLDRQFAARNGDVDRIGGLSAIDALPMKLLIAAADDQLEITPPAGRVGQHGLSGKTPAPGRQLVAHRQRPAQLNRPRSQRRVGVDHLRLRRRVSPGRPVDLRRREAAERNDLPGAENDCLDVVKQNPRRFGLRAESARGETHVSVGADGQFPHVKNGAIIKVDATPRGGSGRVKRRGRGDPVEGYVDRPRGIRPADLNRDRIAQRRDDALEAIAVGEDNHILRVSARRCLTRPQHERADVIDRNLDPPQPSVLPGQRLG